MKKGRRKIGTAADAEISEEVFPADTDAGGSGILFPIKEKLTAATETVRALLFRHRLLVIRTVLPTAYCLLFSGTGFEMGIFPFGISAVCAAQSGPPALIAAAGAFVSSLFTRGGFYIAATAAAAALVLLLLHRFKISADGAVHRAVLSMITGAAHATALSISDGIRFYELCGIFLATALCPVLTVALRGLFSSEGTTDGSTEAGIYVILYTTVYFLRGLSLAGQSAATVISMLAVLFASFSFGIHRGVMAGVAVGLAAEPVYSVIYAAAAAVSGILMPISSVGAVISAVVLALSFGIYGAGAEAFGTLFPEFMFCSAIAIPLFHYKAVPRLAPKEDKSVDTGDINSKRLADTKGRLRALSDSLGAVSTVMRRMSKVFSRPSVTEMRQMCDNAFDESCQSCDGRGTCWDKEYRATATAVTDIAAAVRSGKTVGIGSLPEGVRSRCPYSGAIISRINMGAASAVRTAAKNDSTAAVAESYAAISRLIDEASSEGERELEYDTNVSAELGKRFSAMGLRRAEVSVYGVRRRQIYVRGLEHGCPVSSEEIRSAASSVLGCSITLPEYRITGGAVSLEMHTAEKYAAEFGRYSIAKRGERCGDSITFFRGEGGYSYALISDGMGSGSEAAITSGAGAMFLERMLGAGCSLSSAMEMLNSFLTGRNTECFTTVDIMEADLITGELRFVKSGAAPSFVLRDGRLFKLSSKTVPVGIVTPFDAEQITFSARAGDHVIMLSDGVVPDGDEPAWLYDMLCGNNTPPFITQSRDLADAAEELARTAAEKSGFADDITVGIVRINMA